MFSYVQLCSVMFTYVQLGSFEHGRQSGPPPLPPGWRRSPFSNCLMVLQKKKNQQ
jgi:hypothetical protein